MNPALLLIFILVPFFTNAQSKAGLLAEINKDIWMPFTKGVNTNNPDLYNNINAENFHWVRSGDKTRIMNLKEYIDDANIVMKGRADKGISSELEIRFLERNINAEFASEKCVIKFISKEPGKEPVVSYGVTQVFSVKEKGTWKKIVQYVHVEPATEGIYDGAAAME